MDTDAIHSGAKSWLYAFCGQAGCSTLLCVLLMCITGEWPRFDFSESLSRFTAQPGTAQNSERKNEPLFICIDSKVCLDVLWEGGRSKQKSSREGGERD